MTCEQTHELLTDYMTGDLARDPSGAADELSAHLAACAACREEAEGLRELWQTLGRLPQERPSAALESRFYALLDERIEAAARRDLLRRRGPAAGARPGEAFGARAAAWLERWLPRRPLAQLATTLAALLIGILVGTRHPAAGGGGSGAEMGELRSEVRSLSQLVTLSLLKQESASERLKGVSFGRADSSDERVLDALLDTVSFDPDVNVRLAAIDALAAVGRRPAVQQRFMASLPKQTSPLVQIAMVDLLLASDGGGARRRLQEIAADSRLDPMVKDYVKARLLAHS
ncbi:MAG TPA: hypothetical protein VHR45_23865 [Thermoanaerobaculia bacterium]|nr:hypothetical protein [Thermoanaerobaculia bacterium]